MEPDGSSADLLQDICEAIYHYGEISGNITNKHVRIILLIPREVRVIGKTTKQISHYLCMYLIYFVYTKCDCVKFAKDVQSNNKVGI